MPLGATIRFDSRPGSGVSSPWGCICVQNSSFLAITEIFSCVTSREESEVKLAWKLRSKRSDGRCCHYAAGGRECEVANLRKRGNKSHDDTHHTEAHLPSCGREGEYLVPLGYVREGRAEYLFWKCQMKIAARSGRQRRRRVCVMTDKLLFWQRKPSSSRKRTSGYKKRYS